MPGLVSCLLEPELLCSQRTDYSVGQGTACFAIGENRGADTDTGYPLWYRRSSNVVVHPFPSSNTDRGEGKKNLLGAVESHRCEAQTQTIKKVLIGGTEPVVALPPPQSLLISGLRCASGDWIC